MLSEAFTLILQLPPLVFGPQQSDPWAPPALLTCDIRQLSKPAALRTIPKPLPNLPRFATPRPERPYLLGPRADHLVYVAGILLAGATGGSFDTRSPEERARDKTLFLRP